MPTEPAGEPVTTSEGLIVPDDGRPASVVLAEAGQEWAAVLADTVAATRSPAPALAAVTAVLCLHALHPRPMRSYPIGFCPDPVHVRRPDGYLHNPQPCDKCPYTPVLICAHCDCPNDEYPCPTTAAIADVYEIQLPVFARFVVTRASELGAGYHPPLSSAHARRRRDRLSGPSENESTESAEGTP